MTTCIHTLAERKTARHDGLCCICLHAEKEELQEHAAFFEQLVKDRNIGKPGANRPSLRAYMEELEAENAKLKEWIRYVIRRECWGCYQVDGPTSQRKAMELGLLERHTIGPDEAEEYAGSGFRPGDSIYRFSPILAED